MYLLPLPIPSIRESRHKIHKRLKSKIYTGYDLLENYDINYVHESYHYSQLFYVEVDQASHNNRLEIEYILQNKVDNNYCGVGNVF